MSLIDYYKNIDCEEYNLINYYGKIISTKESQGHGKSTENNIQKHIFKMNDDEIKSYKNNDPHDIRKEHNKLKECIGKNISIKTTGSDTVCCSKISTFLYNLDSIMIISVWKQIDNDTKKIIKTIELDLNILKEKIIEIIKPLTFDGYLEKIKNYEEYVTNLPKGLLINKDYLVKKKSLDNNYITVNPKVDSKGQRRVQCTLNLCVIKNLPSFKLWDGSKYYNHNYCNIIHSPPRTRNSITINKLKIYATDKNIKGPGKRGGWSGMKKNDIINYLEEKGICIKDIK